MDPGTKKDLKSERCIQLSKTLSSLRTPEKADVVLLCGGREFYAHKIILESSSTYFVDLLQNGVQEAKYVKATVDNMETSVLDAILEFIYLGEVEKIITEDQLARVIIASSLLRLHDLVQYCCDGLGKTLSLSNFFWCFNFSQKYSKKGSQLELSLLKLWKTSAAKLVSTGNFLNMPFIQVKEFLHFLTNRKCSLDCMLKGLVNWFRYDVKSRKAFEDELFHCIDPAYLSKASVTSLIKDPQVMRMSENIANWLRATEDAVLDTGSRINTASNGAVYAANFPENSRLTYYSKYKNVEVFDPTLDQYVTTRSKPFKCVQQFDLASMSWLPLQTTQYERSSKSWNTPLYQYGPHVYTIGDKTSWDLKAIQHAERDPFSPLKCPKLAGSEPDTKLSYFKDCLFAIGGSKNGGHTVYVHYIKLGTGEWREATALNYVSNDMEIMATKAYIYVICSNPRIPGEIIIQYSFGPQLGHEWEITRVLSNSLQPNQFFVLGNTLNALYLEEENSKQLTFNHSLNKMKTKRPFSWAPNITEPLVLSKFQNFEGSFVFFANETDHFSIPTCFWEPETGRWAKLPAPNPTPKCEIPNHRSLKMVYDFCDA